MEINDIKKIIESLLFVSDKPLLNREIKAVIKDELSEDIKVEDILKEMQQEYIQLDRSFELKFVADGWTFATKSEYSNWIKKLLKEKTILKLSPSAMEVLAIIAYKQPITRAEIDVIRGVDCGGVIDTLTDRKFIKIVGRKETLGRPLLYGTTQEFLRHFGLSHLSELPIIDTVKDILPNQEENVQELPFDNQESTEDKGDVKIISNETKNVETESVDQKNQPEQQQGQNEVVVTNEENTEKVVEQNTQITGLEINSNVIENIGTDNSSQQQNVKKDDFSQDNDEIKTEENTEK